MKRKRQICLLLCVILCLCGGAACRTKSYPTDNTYHFGTDFNVYLSGFSGNGMGTALTATEAGYYQGQGGRLYYMDKASMDYTIVCNRPECRHEWEDKECTAEFFSGPFEVRPLQYMDGKLYYVERIPDLDKPSFNDDYGIYTMDPDGSNRKMFYRLPEEIEPTDRGVAFHRGYAYVYNATVEKGNEIGEESIWRIPIKGKGQAEKIYSKESHADALGRIMVYGNYLIFYMYEKDQPYLYSMDLETGEVFSYPYQDGENIRECCCAVLKDRLLVSGMGPEGTYLTSYTLSFQDPQPYSQESFHTEMPYRITSDGEYLYKWDSIGIGPLEIYTADGGLMDRVEMDCFTVEEGTFENYEVFADSAEDGICFVTKFFMNKHYYFRKSEIGTGNIQLHSLPEVSYGSTYQEPCLPEK